MSGQVPARPRLPKRTRLQRSAPKRMKLPPVSQQVDFSNALEQLRSAYLLEALLETIKGLDIAQVDRELATFVPASRLRDLAGRGLRGEAVYAVPCVLTANPKLLAYYRLLLGYSGKAFYESGSDPQFFETMETKGGLTEEQRSALSLLCGALIQRSSDLIDGIGLGKITMNLLDDLTLLTLGAQFRGSANTKLGTKAMDEVRELILEIVKPATVASISKLIELQNAAGRKVLISIGADPDVTIREEMSEGHFRNSVSIEVKGGWDRRNIHNRLGEAEKSHQKAKGHGFTEFWTIVNVKAFDLEKAKVESPTTNQFFELSKLLAKTGPAYEDFRRRIVTYSGIR